jgi:hypothetical protein
MPCRHGRGPVRSGRARPANVSDRGLTAPRVRVAASIRRRIVGSTTARVVASRTGRGPAITALKSIATLPHDVVRRSGYGAHPSDPVDPDHVRGSARALFMRRPGRAKGRSSVARSNRHLAVSPRGVRQGRARNQDRTHLGRPRERRFRRENGGGGSTRRPEGGPDYAPPHSGHHWRGHSLDSGAGPARPVADASANAGARSSGRVCC